jgi:hypothetical protein
VDVPAPGIGFACLCNAAYWWNGTACVVEPCVRILAGEGSMNYTGDYGPAALAMLNYPAGVSVDGKGNVYIAGAARNAPDVFRCAMCLHISFRGGEQTPYDTVSLLEFSALPSKRGARTTCQVAS